MRIDEAAYRQEVPSLIYWFITSNLSLNVDKAKRWLLTSGRHDVINLGRTSMDP